MNKSMQVKICGIPFKNPVIAASGTYNFGKEFNELYDIGILGGVSLKGLTREKREGNPSPRIAETYGGVLNSVGLQNPGVERFIAEDAEWLTRTNTNIIVNIAGSTLDDYCYMAERVSALPIQMIELNISCPNVKCGGASFGAYPESVAEVTREVKKRSKKPLIVKLTPNTADITLTAKAAADNGADALSLINTVTGMAVDIKTRRPILANVTGGLSGPAIKPIALRMVYQVHKSVSIPIIGMGGIMTAEDVIEFMLCGASAVQVGTANMINPFAMRDIIENLRKYLADNRIGDINTLIGALKS